MTAKPLPPVDIEWSFGEHTHLCEVMWRRLLVDRGFRDTRGHTHAIDRAAVGELHRSFERILLCQRGDWWVDLLVEIDEGFALVTAEFGSATIRVAANDPASTDAAAKSLAGRLPMIADDERTPARFWFSHSRGVGSQLRRLESQQWSDVRDNYAQATRDALEPLMALEPPLPGGRLILWHGLPGTGKTNALSALADAWRSWCSLEVITDPESLLGGANPYLVEVMSSSDPEHAPRPWRLLVLEDAGELLAADARREAGQGLSRLLNATDGLLGQGSQSLVLVTTNEPLRSIHPAVSRAGRALAEIEFAPLSIEEANPWLSAHSSESRVTQPMVLSDLFALSRDLAVSGRRRVQPVGFAA